MSQITRRSLLKMTGATAALGMFGFPLISRGAYRARVLVVGGGYGGATLAKYLRLANPRIEVILIERDPQFISCPQQRGPRRRAQYGKPDLRLPGALRFLRREGGP